MKLSHVATRLFVVGTLLCTLNGFGVTVSVTTNAVNGVGSLTEAISITNTSSPPNTITFNMSGSAATIALNTGNGLLDVVNAVTIDGTTQPGYSNGFPKVWIRNTGNNSNGINIPLATNVVIRGLKISGFASCGITIGGGMSNRVEACQLIGNDRGITVSSSAWNLLGGYVSSNRNFIAGNTNEGVYLEFGAASNVVAGNWIGVSPTNSSVRQPNGLGGIHIDNSPGNIILGPAGVGQIISGNASYGIGVVGLPSRGTSIRGNSIGIDNGGFAAVSNGAQGILVSGAPDTVIGGTNAADRNIISGNGAYGIEVNLATATGVVIQGNYVGVSSFGSPGIANQLDGVRVQDASGVMIGGAQSGAGNVISGNLRSGIILYSGADNAIVQGNVIGLSSTASGVISNVLEGVAINYALGCQIGGTNAGARNIISGNGDSGITLDMGASGNVIEGNLIGLDGNNFAKPNNRGISAAGGSNNRIGGITAASRNVIAGNRSEGLRIIGPSIHDIWGNSIGVAANGAALSNGTYGVYVGSTGGLTVGGTLTGQGNLISGNGNDGVYFAATTATNHLAGNLIGLDPSGTIAMPNGAAANGVTLYGNGHVVEHNVISGSRQYGIFDSADNCCFTGNIIGLSSNGLSIVSNAVDGLVILGSNTVVGGTSLAERNVIGGNRYGVNLSGAGAHDNTIIGNYIGIGANGTNRVPNRTSGIAVGAGPFNAIGGVTPAERNVIQNLALSGAHDNTFEGNYIGTDALGNELTNITDAIDITGAGTNIIGGSLPGAGNLISGPSVGIWMSGSMANVIRGNRIGVRPNGSRLHSSTGGFGIYLLLSTGNWIGGTNVAEGNEIAYYGAGVAILNSNKNAILCNRIYSNTTLSIDLNADGALNPIDVGDVDTGANDLQNPPVITNLMSFPGSVRVQGYLSSKANQSYRLEFYAGNGSLSGGQFFLGATNCQTSALSSTSAFTVVLSGYATTGIYVRASATDSNNNTSEMFQSSQATLAADTDKDLMPDFWETQYGLNPAVSNTAASDKDGDGVSDYQEYVAGTNPNDSNSVFEITTFADQSGDQVSFLSSAERSYDLLYQTNLASSTNWIPVLTNQPGNGAAMTLQYSATNGMGFYRVSAHIP